MWMAPKVNKTENPFSLQDNERVWNNHKIPLILLWLKPDWTQKTQTGPNLDPNPNWTQQGLEWTQMKTKLLFPEIHEMQEDRKNYCFWETTRRYATRRLKMY